MRSNDMKRVWTGLFLSLWTAAAIAAPSPSETAHYRPNGSDRDFYRCELDLGGDVFWRVAETSVTGAERLYLVAPPGEQQLPQGRRMRAVMREQNIQRGRTPVSRLTRACSQYALRHEGKGPASLEQRDDPHFKGHLAAIQRSPWEGMPGINVAPPYVFLIPNVTFAFSGPRTNRVQRTDRELLAVELTPFVDDGKHWVAYTDHSSERVDIDPALVKQYGLQIRPVMAKEVADAPGTKGKSHILLAVCEAGASEALNIVLTNSLSGDAFSVTWETSRAPTASMVTNDLQRARASAWQPYWARSSGPAINAWAAHASAVDPRVGALRVVGQTSSALGIMGGRAAVRETLQMQQLAGRAGTPAERTIPVTNLPGVTVQSHPYEEMLAGATGGRLALAEVVPADQFLLYVAQPAAILPLLDDGADFLSHLGSVVALNSIKYDLSDRYLAQLGMDASWLQKFLESGVVSEMAIVTPDLFFIDGTDVSVVSRLARPGLVEALLKIIGVSGLSADGVVSHRTTGGRTAYWALRDDLLFLSTHRASLDAMLALKADAGAGSLGRSAEFRYMLTQLPVSSDTRIYAYLSDAFVRRLVGPEVKIAQLRRVTARYEMEFITAMAMRARLDGIRSPTMATLIQDGYLPEAFQDRDYALGEDLKVRSASHGTLTQMATFFELPVNKVSPEEAQLYKRYVDNYSRFWRQFFDPIAMRLDDMPDQSLELTTFILPLVDNSIYNSLRETLHTREDARALNYPVITPSPLVTMSLNLKEAAWVQISEGLHDMFAQYARINPAMLDDLGPGFHLAIHDADPVITLGSGEIFGAFGGNMVARNTEMMMIPTLLSLLTRPCTMVVETQDPAKTRRYLSQAAASIPVGGRRRRSWFGTELHQVSGREEWILTLDIENVLKLRYGLQVDGSHILIRNIPWSSLDRIERVQVSELNAARIDAHPGACVLQLPGLHAAATDGARDAAADSMGHIYPLLLSGVATLDNVEQVHRNLFGFYPVHPGSGQWQWNGSVLSSTTFGSVRRQNSPPYDADDPTFGALKDVDELSLSMQFEDTGLRTKIRWKLK